MAEHVAIQAALEQRRKLGREEEEMTDYRRDELGQDWEFKILRSTSGTFRNPQALSKVLEREAMAGWVLLEKFDDRRIRLKRPVSARQNDAQLPAGYDPYRTQHGLNMSNVAMVIVFLVLGIGVLVGAITGGL